MSGLLDLEENLISLRKEKINWITSSQIIRRLLIWHEASWLNILKIFLLWLRCLNRKPVCLRSWRIGLHRHWPTWTFYQKRESIITFCWIKCLYLEDITGISHRPRHSVESDFSRNHCCQYKHLACVENSGILNNSFTYFANHFLICYLITWFSYQR